MSEWQPIKTAPRDGTDILLIGIYGVLTKQPTCIGWYDPYAKRWIDTYGGKETFPPSHWLPLPKPPENKP